MYWNLLSVFVIVCDCFFCLEQFWRCWVQKHSSFVCRLNGYRAQLCSTFVVSAASASRPTAPGKPPEATRRCTMRRAAAKSRLRSFWSRKAPQWTPRTTMARGLKAGSRAQKSSLRFGAPQKVFSCLKFMDFAYHGCSQYQRIAASPCQCCCIVGLKLPDCSRSCSSDEREIADVARGNERQQNRCLMFIGASCNTKHEKLSQATGLCKKDVMPPQFFWHRTPLDPWDLEPDFRSCYLLFTIWLTWWDCFK